MGHILFTDQPAGLKRFLRRHAVTSCRVLQLEFDQNAAAALALLNEQGLRAQVLAPRDHLDMFEHRYAAFLGELNMANAGPLWWALDLTNKNPITTGLFSSVYLTLLVSRIMARDPQGLLVVLSRDTLAAQQLRRHFKAAGPSVRVSVAIRRPLARRHAVPFVPLAAVYGFLRALAGRTMARMRLPRFLPPSRPLTVIMSLLYAPVFTDKGFRDAYFGPFVDHVRARGEPLLNLMEVCAPYGEMMKRTAALKGDLAIYPREYFLTLGGALACLGQALRQFFTPVRWRGRCAIEGVDVSLLVRRAISHEHTSTRFINNLLVRRCVQDLARRYPPARFYYPFENRSFEKMMVLALRTASPSTRIIGYQHASFSARHTNFLLADGEAGMTPLPDVIMTIGQVTRDILARDGRFPPEVLVAGCALRAQPFPGGLRARRPLTNVLVALATGLDEYVKVLAFLDAALGGGSGYRIRLRPHPVFPFAEALAIYGTPRFSYEIDRAPLAESLAWADALAYVHSSLAVEALMRGIPVVCLDIQEPADPDPLFDFTAFKWKAGRPADLLPALDAIRALDAARHAACQKEGAAFAADYLRPVSQEGMEQLRTI